MVIRQVYGFPVACLAAGSVAAEEQTLNFRLVPKMISGAVLKVANVEGRTVSAGDYVWVKVRAEVSGAVVSGWVAGEFLRLVDG